MFADDTSIIISNTDLHEFKHNIDVVLQETNNWFISNLLALNYNKTHFLQFLVKKQNEIKIQIMTSNTVLTNINRTKFLGLPIDNTLSWREHIAALTTKLNKAYVEIKRQLDATDDFYCRSYCLLNMFRTPLCPSSGAREYYTSGCCLSYLMLGFQVVGMVWC